MSGTMGNHSKEESPLHWPRLGFTRCTHPHPSADHGPARFNLDRAILPMLCAAHDAAGSAERPRQDRRALRWRSLPASAVFVASFVASVWCVRPGPRRSNPSAVAISLLSRLATRTPLGTAPGSHERRSRSLANSAAG